MNDLRIVKFCGHQIVLSGETLAHLATHSGLMAIGSEALCRIDPKCKIENELLEKIEESFREDIAAAVQHLKQEEMDLVLEALEEADSSTLLDLLFDD